MNHAIHSFVSKLIRTKDGRHWLAHTNPEAVCPAFVRGLARQGHGPEPGLLHWLSNDVVRKAYVPGFVAPHLTGTVLSVGSGTGALEAVLPTHNTKIRQVVGYEPAPPRNTLIPTTTTPLSKLQACSYDTVLFIDVIHHVTPADVPTLLRNALTLAKKRVVIKDHLGGGLWRNGWLHFLDALGNREDVMAHGTHYLTMEEWKSSTKTAIAATWGKAGRSFTVGPKPWDVLVVLTKA